MSKEIETAMFHLPIWNQVTRNGFERLNSISLKS